jgi:hypothetical protein
MAHDRKNDRRNERESTIVRRKALVEGVSRPW